MARRKVISISTDEPTHTAVEQLQDDRDCSKSEAAETALSVGLDRLGYGRGAGTPAGRLVDVAAIGVFHVGATLVLLSLLGSVSLLFAGVGALFGSLGLTAVSRVVIPKLEPDLSNKLPSIEVQ